MSGRVLLYTLSTHDPVSIGSDRALCKIQIEGAAPRHAELFWDTVDEAWFVRADPTAGTTLLNGEPIQSGRLFEGRSVITVANVRIRLEGNELYRLGSDEARGISITVRDLSAKICDPESDDGWRFLLKDVSFSVKESSFTAILGPSGEGKSTLLQRLAGFPFNGKMTGSICFNGNPLSGEKEGSNEKQEKPPSREELLSHVAYLPQAVEDTLHDDMTVLQEMELFARKHLKTWKEETFKGVFDSVFQSDSKKTNWTDFRGRTVGKLSGGQKRRLALALALLRDPQLLLLDEPTAGLDPAAEDGVMSLLRGLSGEGKTVLCATHVLGTLDRWCRNDNTDNVYVVLVSSGQVSCPETPDKALARFPGADWLAVYDALSKNRWNPCREEFDNPAPGALPLRRNEPPSWPRPFRATLGRLWRSVLAHWNPLLFFGVPLIVSAILLAACGTLFEKREEGTVYFCMSVAMFWFGLSATFRNLVSERVPKRCLDRMHGMPLPRYFFAHVTFALLAAAVQSILFVLPLFVARLGHPPYSPWAFLPFFFDLTLVGFCGGCIGLAVSAGAKKELYAAWLLPLVTIPVLFLSKPVLGFERGKEPEQPLRVTEEWFMPTLLSQTVLETSMHRAQVYHIVPSPQNQYEREILAKNPGLLENDRQTSFENWKKRREKRDKNSGIVLKNPDGSSQLEKSWSDKHVDDVLRFFALVAGHTVVFLGLAFCLQRWRERNWDGR